MYWWGFFYFDETKTRTEGCYEKTIIIRRDFLMSVSCYFFPWKGYSQTIDSQPGITENCKETRVYELGKYAINLFKISQNDII